MKPLPSSLDEVRGLRAARWIRESTTDQYERYGPASQRKQQDDFIARHGLLDTGLVFEVAHSGTTVHRSGTMATMLSAARAGSFDLLLAGYSDRWQRNLRWTLQVLEDDLHPAGVALVMCDRRILSSDRNDWDEFVAESTSAAVQPPTQRPDQGRLRREVRAAGRSRRPRPTRLPPLAGARLRARG